MFFAYSYFFLVGMTFGSFFNVVGLRVPKKESIVSPRSACPNCSKLLSWYELIPVISFLIQKGQCRNCQNQISIRYLFFELVTGLLFAFALYKIGWNVELIVALTFISLLVIISVSDLAYMIIPNRILFFFLMMLSIERIFIPLSPWHDSLLGALTGFLFLYFIALLSKGGMGGGDIKLFFVIGLVLGVKGVFLTFFVATLIGTFFSIGGMILQKLHRKSAIPFGPFISLGAIIAYFYQNDIIHLYMNFLLL